MAINEGPSEPFLFLSFFFCFFLDANLEFVFNQAKKKKYNRENKMENAQALHNIINLNHFLHY